jgi:hypothetical protein
MTTSKTLEAIVHAAPATAAADAHHQLGEYNAYAALAAMLGADVAEDETGAPLEVHAVRLAAALSALLAEHAALRVIAAEVLEVAAVLA